MATISTTTDQAAELLQKLSLDPLNKPLQDAEAAKKSSAAQYTPADMAAQANGLNKPTSFERTTSALPDFMDTQGDILHQPIIMEVIMDLRAMIGIGIQVVTGLICLKEALNYVPCFFAF